MKDENSFRQLGELFSHINADLLLVLKTKSFYFVNLIFLKHNFNITSFIL